MSLKLGCLSIPLSLADSISLLYQILGSRGLNQWFLNHAAYGRSILKIVKEISPRFDREIEIARNYRLTFVPEIFEFSTRNIGSRQYNYVVEQFIEGSSLKEELQRAPLSIKKSIELLESLLRIAVELEVKQIVHRDIKPDNIICCESGEYYLIDFGIARILTSNSLTFTGAAMGPHTPGYGAPELFQYSKSEIDSRADLFSIGIVVYEAIFGKHPFISGSEIDVREIWYKTANITPSELSIEGDNDRKLISFLQTLMQKHISRRPSSARTAMDWFENIKKSVHF